MSWRGEANRLALHFSRGEIFHTSCSLLMRPGVWKVRVSQSHRCLHTIQTQWPARLAAGCAILVTSWLVFSCAAASLQEVAGSLFLQHLLGHWHSQAQRRNCRSGNVSSLGAASSQKFTGREGTRSKLQVWLAGLSKCQAHEPARA